LQILHTKESGKLLIDNPAFKGEWKPRQIANPNYFVATDPYKLEPIGGLGIELWTMTDNIMFDNILVAHSKAQVDEFTEKTWKKKHTAEENLKAEEAAKNAPGIVEQVRKTVEPTLLYVMEFVSDPDNLVFVIVGGAVVTVLPLLLCIFCCGRSTEPKEPQTKERKEAKKEPKQKKEQPEQQQGEEKSSPKGNKKKRKED